MKAIVDDFLGPGNNSLCLKKHVNFERNPIAVICYNTFNLDKFLNYDSLCIICAVKRIEAQPQLQECPNDCLGLAPCLFNFLSKLLQTKAELED